MSEIKLVTIILPTYNEKENIVDLVKAIYKAVQQPKEILVVDDDSPDGTSQLVQYEIDKGEVIGLRLLTRKANKGLTNSIWDGIQHAKGDVVVWMDCDFSMPPEDIPKLLKKIEEGYDVAVGSRFVKGGSFKQNTKDSEDSWLAVLLSRFMNIGIRLMLHWSFRDYTSGFIAIRKQVFEKIKLRGDYGEYFIDMIFRCILLNYKVVEIPYICLPRERGYSKTGSNLKDYMKRGIKYLQVTMGLLPLKIKHKLFRIIPE